MVTHEHNLGVLILELVKLNLTVTVGLETSMIGPNIVMMKIVQIRNGKSISHKEAISTTTLESITDAKVVAAAIAEKMRKMT